MRSIPQLTLKPDMNPNLSEKGFDKKSHLTHKRGLKGQSFLIKNKKGFTQWLFVGIAVALLLGFILFSKGVLGFPSLHSLTPKSANYDKKTCPNIGVTIGGELFIEDSGALTLNPSISSFNVDDVLSGGNELCFFCKEADFTYIVTGVDDISGASDSFKGTSTLKSSDNEPIPVPYTLNYQSPDFNCDSKIDDLNLKLTAKIKGKDVGDRTEITKFIRIRKGAIE